MSDKIEVGDRVHDFCYGNGTVLALHLALDGECWVWSEYDKPKTCYGTRITDLTRLDPEPVTLTPKYAVGQEVKFQGGIYSISIEKVVVAYELTGWFGLRAEDSLEPAPEPCPKCKGSGKASE